MQEDLKKSQEIKPLPSTEKISEVKEKYLKIVRALRFDHVEESFSKINKVFFSNISGVIKVLKSYGLINSPEIKKECEDFFKFCDTIRGTSRLYKQEDIDIANKMLDSLIKELS